MNLATKTLLVMGLMAGSATASFAQTNTNKTAQAKDTTSGHDIPYKIIPSNKNKFAIGNAIYSSVDTNINVRRFYLASKTDRWAEDVTNIVETYHLNPMRCQFDFNQSPDGSYRFTMNNGVTLENGNTIFFQCSGPAHKDQNKRDVALIAIDNNVIEAITTVDVHGKTISQLYHQLGTDLVTYMSFDPETGQRISKMYSPLNEAGPLEEIMLTKGNEPSRTLNPDSKQKDGPYLSIIAVFKDVAKKCLGSGYPELLLDYLGNPQNLDTLKNE